VANETEAKVVSGPKMGHIAQVARVVAPWNLSQGAGISISPPSHIFLFTEKISCQKVGSI
jgi:hypothetical protein